MEKNIDIKERNYEKFFTPSYIAKYMVGLLGPKEGDVILEPSAGKGSIVRAIKEHNAGCIVMAFDINEQFEPFLRNAGANVVVIKDFLSIPIYAHFTSCIANPPFGNGIDLQAHFDCICDHVKSGGKIVMIVPQDFNPTYEKHLIKNYTAHALDNWSKNSDGTTTQIKIIEFNNK